MIDADFERAMNGGRTKHEQAARRDGRFIMSDHSSWMVRLPISPKGWDNSSKGRPDPIGQGEVW